VTLPTTTSTTALTILIPGPARLTIEVLP